jgi:hypothetical protein
MENEQESSVKMIFFNKRAMKKITKCSMRGSEEKNAATIMNNCSMRTIQKRELSRYIHMRGKCFPRQENISLKNCLSCKYYARNHATIRVLIKKILKALFCSFITLV